MLTKHCPANKIPRKNATLNLNKVVFISQTCFIEIHSTPVLNKDKRRATRLTVIKITVCRFPETQVYKRDYQVTRFGKYLHLDYQVTRFGKYLHLGFWKS
ncbi:uncharacterized protein LOC144651886 isoform X4 [Oculina patagonica]